MVRESDRIPVGKLDIKLLLVSAKGVHFLLAPSLSLFYFTPPFFQAVPQLTEGLEEANSGNASRTCNDY